MKTVYYVKNPLNGHSYGPMRFYPTAEKIANHLDDVYHETIAKIEAHEISSDNNNNKGILRNIRYAH
jgi:hypothetical protein